MKLRRRLRGSGLAFLTGGLFALGVIRSMGPSDDNRLALLLAGGFYGIAIWSLMRLFPVAPWTLPIIGLLVGPVPQALFVNAEMSGEDRGGLYVITSLLGLLIGLVEWGRRGAREGLAEEGSRGEIRDEGPSSA